MVNLGCLRYGQNADFLIKLVDNKLVKGKTFEAQLSFMSQGTKFVKKLTDIKVEDCDSMDNMPHVFRYESIDIYRHILANWQ